jgi:hypothetical protein
VKVCVAVPKLFVAVRVIAKLPMAVEVPLRLAVPFPLLVNVTPLGRAPASVIAATGKPVVITVNEPATPA